MKRAVVKLLFIEEENISSIRTQAIELRSLKLKQRQMILEKSFCLVREDRWVSHHQPSTIYKAESVF